MIEFINDSNTDVKCLEQFMIIIDENTKTIMNGM